VTGIGIGSVGVWCSAAMKRTQPATVSAFVVTALLVLGASGAWIILAARASNEGATRPPEALLYLNPFAAVSDVICEATGSGCFVGESLARTSEPVPEAQPIGLGPVPAGQGPQPDGQQFGGPFVQPVVVGGDFWPKSVLSYILLTAIALFGAAQSVSPTRRWRWSGRKRPQLDSGEAIDD
jgi:hypothetical protein